MSKSRLTKTSYCFKLFRLKIKHFIALPNSCYFTFFRLNERVISGKLVISDERGLRDELEVRNKHELVIMDELMIMFSLVIMYDWVI